MNLSIKLKFKIELACKLLKANDELIKDPRNKSKTSLLRDTNKSSIRNSKINLNNDYDSLPGYEAVIAKLSPEDREELNSYMKVFNTTTLTGIFNLLQSKKLYSRLKSKTGIELLKYHYNQAVKKLKDSIYISDECELYLCLKDYIEMSDLDCMDIFDIFKFNEFFAFTEQCFIILVFFLSSYECGFLTDFFQYFYEDLFVMISGGENTINVSRLKDVGKLIGINERLLAAHAKDLNLEWTVEKLQFKEYYCTLLKTTDEKIQYNTLMSTKKQNLNTKGTCMNNKTCNIL
jgi:hypothetical protein